MANPNVRLIRQVIKLRDRVAETLGPFIAGDRPDDPILGPYHDYTRWVCDSYAQVPGWARTATQTAGVQWLAIDASIGETCRQYLGDGMPIAAPPFVGGQCSGVLYRVFVITRRFDGVGCSNSAETNFGNYLGPIGAPYSVPSVPPSPPGNTWFFTANGTPVSIGFLGTVPCSSAGVVGFRVQRVDGQPDNCGSLRPKLPTPSPTRPPDPGPNPPGGGQPPVFGPRGTPIFRPGPIRSPYDEPDVPFPPVDPYYPEDGGEDDPYYGPDNPPPGDPGNPGDPAPTGDGGEEEGEAPEGAELVGLKINLLVIPSSAKEYSPGVYRGVCYVYMGNDAGLDQDYAGSMISDGQFIFAERDGLTKWRVVANPGYSVLVTPYYREVE